jgi:hypothetical protein
VPVAGLLPTTPAPDDLAVTRQQAKRLFDELLKTDDQAVLLLLTQLLARLSEAANRVSVGIKGRPGTARE